MAVNRGSFADLLTPGFRQIFDDKYSETPMVMDKLYHMNTSAKDTEKDSAVTGFGLAVQTSEGAPIDYEDPIQMYDTTYTHLKYTKGFKITKEMYDDDLYGIMNKRPAALGKAMRRTAEDLASKVFINAFSTSYLGADGLPLCSTKHNRADGGTVQSNAHTSGITLTETNLETGLLAMRGQKDDKGMKIDVYPDKILVPPALRKTAHLIIDSPMRSGTADNDMNVYKGSLDIIDWIYLTSTTAWFLIDSSEHELNWFWRERPQFKSDELFDTEYAVYKSTMRLSRGWSDWRGIYGSQGDGASYTD